MSVIFSACYYDVEETLYVGTHCGTTGLSYELNISPILQRNCYACHSISYNSSNINLEDYDNLFEYAKSGKLLGAIRHDAGFKPMPDGASKLINCDIAKIKQWIDEGALNN